MPQQPGSYLLTITGDEATQLELEDYANFLRDLVLVHDRIWILASTNVDSTFPKIYYSNFFYTRGHKTSAARAAT